MEEIKMNNNSNSSYVFVLAGKPPIR